MLSVDASVAAPAGPLRARFDLEPGVTALIGDRGAGKSALLAHLAAAAPTGSVTARVGERSRLRVTRSVAGNLRLGQLAGRRRGGAAGDLARIVAALGLADVLAAPVHQLGASTARLVELGRALLACPDLLLVDVPHGVAAPDRRRVLGLLRWAAARERPRTIVYVARRLADLDDLADRLIVLREGTCHGPGEPWTVLGRTLRGPLADELGIESSLSVEVDYLDEEGRWLRVVLGNGAEVHLPFVRLSPGWRGRIAVPAAAVLLLGQPLPGRRLTNQLRGRITAVGDLLGRRLVSVEVSGAAEPLRALVEPDTVREQGFAVGREVVCAFEPAAVRWDG